MFAAIGIEPVDFAGAREIFQAIQRQRSLDTIAPFHVADRNAEIIITAIIAFGGAQNGIRGCKPAIVQSAPVTEVEVPVSLDDDRRLYETGGVVAVANARTRSTTEKRRQKQQRKAPQDVPHDAGCF